jgi:hypothetical protein
MPFHLLSVTNTHPQSAHTPAADGRPINKPCKGAAGPSHGWRRCYAGRSSCGGNAGGGRRRTEGQWRYWFVQVLDYGILIQQRCVEREKIRVSRGYCYPRWFPTVSILLINSIIASTARHSYLGTRASSPRLFAAPALKHKPLLYHRASAPTAEERYRGQVIRAA